MLRGVTIPQDALGRACPYVAAGVPCPALTHAGACYFDHTVPTPPANQYTTNYYGRLKLVSGYV